MAVHIFRIAVAHAPPLQFVPWRSRRHANAHLAKRAKQGKGGFRWRLSLWRGEKACRYPLGASSASLSKALARISDPSHEGPNIVLRAGARRRLWRVIKGRCDRRAMCSRADGRAAAGRILVRQRNRAGGLSFRAGGGSGSPNPLRSAPSPGGSTAPAAGTALYTPSCANPGSNSPDRHKAGAAPWRARCGRE